MAIRYLIFFLFFSLSCAKQNDENSVAYGSPSLVQMNKAAQIPGEDKSVSPRVFERKLVKTGSVSFQSKDLKKSRQRINALLSKYKAYISSDRTQHYPTQIENNLIIRIPSDHFDTFVNELEPGNTFETKNIEITDVSEAFYDSQARLRTKKEIENRYIHLLSAATKVEEILQVEKQIGELRTEIEVIEGRLKVLDNQTSLSTLNLRLYQKREEKGTDFSQHFSKGFKQGGEHFIWFFVGLANVWPFLLMIFAMTFLAIRWWKKAS